MRLRVVVFICALLGQSLGLITAAPAAAADGGLELSELLVDPVTPQTDTHDEYIEFHNAGTTELNLNAYKLKLGADPATAKTYALPDKTIAADAYAAGAYHYRALSRPRLAAHRRRRRVHRDLQSQRLPR